MHQLHKDRAVVLVHGCRNEGVPRHVALFVQPEPSGDDVSAPRPLHCTVLHDDETYPAFGYRAIEIRHSLGPVAGLIGITCARSGLDDAVLGAQAADIAWLQ